MSNLQEQINAARDYIQARTKIKPEIALVLGSGLGGLVDEIEIDAEFPYNEIPNFHVSTVHGHAGKLVLGKLFGREVVVMQGRLHYYEGHPMTAVIFPTRVMHALGAETFVVTNAAGGLNPEFRPGDVMLMPEGTKPPESGTTDWVVRACIERGWRYCRRLHIDLFGDTRGT